MAPESPPATIEHLAPHDLVTYFRCPHEMELHRARRTEMLRGTPLAVRTPADVIPLHRSPLLTPPLAGLVVNDGRFDVFAGDVLVYEDEGEEDLPVLFPSDQVRRDARFQGHDANLSDPELAFRGRPDFVVQRADGSLVPIEYKATHLFVGYHESHGRLFDAVQAISECRLVEAAFGRRPPYGVVLYGDQAGDGEREGWVQIPYTEASERWLRYALAQVRSDATRAPVPGTHTCPHCEPNGEGLCRYAGARFEGAPRGLTPLPAVR